MKLRQYTKKHFQYLYKGLKTGKYWYLGIALAAIICGLIQLHQFSYSSDDVAEQTIIESVQERGLHDTWLPPDPWIWKYPLYVVVGHLTPSSRSQILLESILMNVFLALCAYVAFGYFLKKITGKDKHSSRFFIWYAWIFSLNFGFLGFLRMPNSRNLELGLLLLALVVFDKIYYSDFSYKKIKKRLFAALFIIFLAISFFSDPYFLVLLLGYISTLFALDVLKKDFRVKEARKIALILLGGLTGYFILKVLLNYVGFHVNNVPAEIVKITDLPQKISLSIHGLAYMFTVESPLDESNPLRVLLRTSNQVIGIMGLLLALRSIVLFKQAKKYELIFAIQPTILLFAYILLKSPFDIGTARYLILIVLYLPMIYSGAVHHFNPRIKSAFYLIVGTIVVLNISMSICGSFGVLMGHNQLASANNSQVISAQGESLRNQKEKSIIKELQTRGLTKGYGSYWESTITSYLSDYSIEMGPIICDERGRVRPYYWVVQDKIYNPEQQKSFFLFNSKHLNHTACDMKKFGDYKESIVIDSTTVVFVYDYDVASKFPKKESLSKPD